MVSIYGVIVVIADVERNGHGDNDVSPGPVLASMTFSIGR